MGRERFYSGGRFEKLAAYSRATRVGNRIVVSGTAAIDENGAVIGPGDAHAQTQAALVIALQAIEALGGSREQIVFTRLYLVPDSDWRGCVRAHQEAFDGVDPANTTLYVSGLIPEGALVEVELEADVTA